MGLKEKQQTIRKRFKGLKEYMDKRHTYSPTLMQIRKDDFLALLKKIKEQKSK